MNTRPRGPGRGRRRSVAAGIAVGGWALATVLLAGTPAGAAELSGCSGTAQSFDGTGQKVDEVTGPGTGGTKSDPFTVDRDGRVSYSGSSTDVLQNGSWSVDTGLGWSVSGPVTNASGQKQWSGSDVVADRIPFDAPGLYHVSFTVKGAPGTTACTGSLWVEVAGSPLFTPLWIGGVVLGLAGGAEVVTALVSVLRSGVQP